MLSTSYAGWQLSLRPYITRPNDALIFQYAAKCKLDDMLRLFSEGKASPFDRDERGRNLLHHYNYSGHFDLNATRKLMALGVDLLEEDEWGLCPLYKAADYVDGSEDSVSLFQSLVENKEEIDMITLDQFWTCIALRRSDHELNQQLLLQLNPHHFSQSFDSRSWMYTGFSTTPDPELIKTILWKGRQVDHEEVKQSLKQQQSVAHYVSWLFGMSYPEREGQSEWRRLLADIFMKSSPHELHGMNLLRPLTPMCVFLAAVWSNNEIIVREGKQRNQGYAFAIKHMSLALSDWLVAVETFQPQADLQRYGEEESKILLKVMGERLWESSRANYGPPGERLGPRLISFQFGPSKNDWDLEWDMDFISYCPDFWRMVEDHKFHDMPGSWPSWATEESELSGTESRWLSVAKQRSQLERWRESDDMNAFEGNM